MSSLLEMALANAAGAAVLAVVALAVGCVCRRPAVLHALWLLVLLKLFAPPLVRPAVRVLPPLPAEPAAPAVAAAPAPVPATPGVRATGQFLVLPAPDGGMVIGMKVDPEELPGVAVAAAPPVAAA